MNLSRDYPHFELVAEPVKAPTDDVVRHCDWCGHIHKLNAEHFDVNKLCSESCCNK